MYSKSYIVYRHNQRIGNYDALALAQDKAEREWDKEGGHYPCSAYTIRVCAGGRLLTIWTMMEGCDWI